MPTAPKSTSLKVKISGSFLLLLSIMLAVIVFSYHQSDKVDKELALLAKTVIPLTNHVANLTAYALEQTVIFERILRLRQETPTRTNKINASIKRLNEYSEKVSYELAQAQSILEERLIKGDIKHEVLILLAQIPPSLKTVEKEHNDFNLHVSLLLKREKIAAPEVRHLLNQQLEGQIDNLGQALYDVLQMLERLTESESKTVMFGELSIHQGSLIIGVIVFLVGIVISPLITLRIVKPLKELSEGAKKISKGDLSINIPIHSRDEVGELTHSFNKMAEELKNKERIKNLFGKYVDPRIIESVIDKGEELFVNDSQKKKMTVFFSDIEGFSEISESLTANGLVKLMNHYFTHASQPIYRHNGVIDKFIGDAIMAFWGAPFSNDKHAIEACEASLEYLDSLTKINLQIPEILGFKKNAPQINVRIGLCTGDVVAGNIGSNDCMSYTVLGDTVNIAARLESANKKYGTRIIMEQNTHDMIKDHFETRKIDRIRVVGIQKPIEIFELLAKKSQLEPSAETLRTNYESALQCYQCSDFTQAKIFLDHCLEITPNDGPSQALNQRMEIFAQTPPANDWDGIWQLESK